MGRYLLLLLFTLPLACQTPVSIGRIAGGDTHLRGQLEIAADGTITLMSGAQVDVRSGTARLAVQNGEARFCGPLMASVLKASGPGDPGAGDELPLLFSISSGTVELEYTGAASWTVQSALYSVSTLPFAQAAARKLAVRVTPSGETCVAALAGTLRVREQVGSAEMLIPPGRAMLVTAAGVEKASPVQLGACNCGASAAALKTPASLSLEPPVAASAQEAARTETTIAAAPLSYDASNQPKPEGPPKEPEVTLPVVVSGVPTEQPATAEEAKPAPQPVEPKPVESGFMAKVKRFFRALFGGAGSRPQRSC